MFAKTGSSLSQKAYFFAKFLYVMYVMQVISSGQIFG
jgi:hypothetical protein